MQRERQIRELVVQPLELTYEQYEHRQSTIKNTCIGKYVVYDLIGKGSYGSVFKGMDDQSKKQVAVKLIDMKKIRNQPNHTIRNIQLRLAQSEPKLMYMCNSPYLLKCFDVFENEDLKVMIIQYCNGDTLQKQIDTKGRIPENEAWIILKHIINGLMELHSYKIVHRDLKADNIMSHNGTYKIIDFGFSKKLQISQESAEVRNTSLGTITTMAPEVMGRKPYGLKADIWSLGIIFFQMIYGTYPYDSLTAAQMYRQIQSKRLFNSQVPFTHNGYTPSPDAYRFLRFTIVVQTEQRPNWKQVSQFPNIKNAADQDLSQRFLNRCDVVYNKALDCDIVIEEGSKVLKQGESPKKEEKLQIKAQKHKVQEKPKPVEKQVNLEERWKELVNQLKETNPKKEQLKVQSPKQQKKVITQPKVVSPKKEEPKIQQPKQEKIAVNQQPRKNKFNLQQPLKVEKQKEQKKALLKKKEEGEIKKVPRVEPVNTRKLNNEQIQKKQREIDQEEDQQYEWVQNAHLQCLKTQFVFRQIFNPLDISTALKKENRATIEFFYLLAARCFNNMSPIQDQIDERAQKGKRKDQIENLSQQVSPLYKQVRAKFLELSQKLTESQNKVTSMVFDWFAKKITKDNFKEKDRFLTGIENLEYSKDEQIDYTSQYYEQYIKNALNTASNVKSTVKRLQQYRKLLKVKLPTLRQYKKSFDEYKQMTINEK